MKSRRSVEDIATEEKDAALHDLAKRCERNIVCKIDNVSLPAGSALYYYCKYCCILTGILAESDFRTRPKKCCSQCRELEQMGWVS